MGGTPGTTFLNYAAAAKRVGRSTGAINRWRRDGMPMTWRTGSDGQRERVVREDVLLAWWRDRLKSSPVHFYRMRAAAREEGRPDPARPVPVTRAPRPPASRECEPEPSQVSEPVFTPPSLRGGPEYDTLSEALKTAEPSCRDLESFTGDRIDSDEAEIMARICAGCDVLDQCRTFAERSRPDSGYWAGKAWGQTVSAAPSYQDEPAA